MKQVSLQELKRSLSSIIAKAEGGATVVVTRHKKPVAQIIPALQEHCHTGKLFGKGNLTSAFHRSTGGRYLEILDDDRNSDPGNH